MEEAEMDLAELSRDALFSAGLAKFIESIEDMEKDFIAAVCSTLYGVPVRIR